MHKCTAGPARILAAGKAYIHVSEHDGCLTRCMQKTKHDTDQGQHMQASRVTNLPYTQSAQTDSNGCHTTACPPQDPGGLHHTKPSPDPVRQPHKLPSTVTTGSLPKPQCSWQQLLHLRHAASSQSVSDLHQVFQGSGLHALWAKPLRSVSDLSAGTTTGIVSSQ